MIVSVDLGNKNIKTPELLFLTGLDSYDSNPSTTFFRNDCIQYEGKYYTVGSHRIEYTRYKHTDDRFNLNGYCERNQTKRPERR